MPAASDFEIVRAAGFTAAAMDSWQLFQCAGRITRDAWLTARAEQFAVEGVLADNVRTRIVLGLSELERQALRERTKQ